jgi:ankyrin repeat protein
LSVKLNEVDSKGDLPLDLALNSRQESIAQTLVKHKVDVNKRDNSGKCLLHKAIKRGMHIYRSKFILLLLCLLLLLLRETFCFLSVCPSQEFVSAIPPTF